MALDLIFKKHIVVGVSVNPELGLEVAQVDFDAGVVLKYGCKNIAYDNARKEIADMDIFKETLEELMFELQIPKGSEVFVNLPSVVFKVSDYPASFTEDQVNSAIEEDLSNNPILQDTEPCISSVVLPNSTMQFNKYVYTAAQKVMLVEIAMQIKELGYKLIGIDTSVNSTLNALLYNGRVDVNPNTSWVLLLVDNSYCRIILMQGKNYVDTFDERISIGEVLGDAENYATIVEAANPILKNLPSQCLYVISKTNIISAKVLADKLVYNAPIIHQEDNYFSMTPFLPVSEEIGDDVAQNISIDVIGAAINRDFSHQSNAKLNLFNATLGDIYLMNQPPILKIGKHSLVLSLENMILASILVFILAIVVSIVVFLALLKPIGQSQDDLALLETKISKADAYLKENKAVSSEIFDEGDEIRIGLVNNKNIYSYYTIVGTEIPQKLWLTKLELGKNVLIEGQADNLASIYSFFRNIKDYTPNSALKLKKLSLAADSSGAITRGESLDTDSIITSMNADYYEFVISDIINIDIDNNNDNVPEKTSSKTKTKTKKSNLPKLEPLD